MIAHFDCFAGASGDMLLGSMIDAGASADAIGKHIDGLGLGQVKITVDEVHRRGIRATRIEVEGFVETKTYSQARDLLTEAACDEQIRSRSLSILSRLAAAEARVHGVDMDDVHFHELSAVDTIVDIVGVSAALLEMGITSCTSSPVSTGWGTISTQHGQLPVPAPAVLELLRDAQMRQIDILAELVTPTGAAILAEICEGFGVMPSMAVRATGYGAGAAELEIPNVVRVVVGDPVAEQEGQVDEFLLEANIDDMNPEMYEFVSQRLFDAGASDVWLVPVIGKRGRPANVISVLAPPSVASTIRHLLVAETSTIGVRTTSVGRWMLERDWVEVEVGGQAVRIKVARDGGRVVNMAPEYADCVRVAELTGMALKEVFSIASAEARRRLER